MERKYSVPLQNPSDAANLSTLKYEASVIHPVAEIEKQAPKNEKLTKRRLMAAVYGAALPMRMMMQEHQLSQCRRLPGLPSSFASLDSFTGRAEKFGFDDYLNLPFDSPEAPDLEMREQIERDLGLEISRPL